MIDYNKPINEVIKEYPIIEEFLIFNEIDCASCSVGTCLVSDILEIHSFSKQDQKAMYEYIDKLVNKEASKMVKFNPLTKTDEYSPIIMMLMEEHRLILELIYITEYIIVQDNFYNKYHNDLNQIVTYLKEYADNFHHGKEEDVLFYLFEDSDILNAMYHEHGQGRAIRKAILASDDSQEIKGYLQEYIFLLKDHIHKEDNILFPYLDRNITPEMMIEINESLTKIDLKINEDVKQYIDTFNSKIFTI